MTEYYNKYIKYKNKYLSLKSQIGSAALRSVKKKLFNFIFISNTYSGTRNELPGVRIDRQNILDSLNIERKYGEVFIEHGVGLQLKSDFHVYFITNCNKAQTLEKLQQIRETYDVHSTVLCLSGHGSNDTGLINFFSEKGETINLSEIIGAIDNPNLVNITAFLDMCRTGEEHNPFNASRLVNSIRDKRVAVITAGARTFSVTEDNINGGKLIKSLCEVLNPNNIYASLKSMEEMLKFIGKVALVKIKQHQDSKSWPKIIRERKISPETNELYNKICRELPSLYVNNLTRQVIEERGLLKNFRKLFEFLCKEYDKDGKLSYAAVKTHPTKFRVS
jgi:hypothetical protein|tara:strand:- start:100 stop:1101 length:1002 start_codon:yes stop_codon:yes gene_type:complete